MSEENRQQQSSAEATVAGAAKTGKAIASIAKGAATGGAHGAAVEAAKSSKKWTIPIVAVILLPVLIIAMLPSVIFGSLFGDAPILLTGFPMIRCWCRTWRISTVVSA